MTNYEKWQKYFENIPSPQSYIDFAFYYTISSALQRRVWMGSKELTLFPNVYIFLVGDPGIGKGLALKPVINCLRHYKWNPGTGKIEEESHTDEKGQELLAFPSSPESTTYEALVDAISKSTRRVLLPDGKIYSHNSMFFALEEISSMFKKNTENIVQFLLAGYDCGEYKRTTKTQGISTIKKCCINFIGGTTPSFMEQTFTDNLLGDGFASRCWFVYEYCNRFNRWNIAEFNEAQLEAKIDILKHIRALAELYGEIRFTEEADEYLRSWFEEQHSIGVRANHNIKLASYYARKNIHVRKLCMILHFSECADIAPIGIGVARRALQILDELERRMHLALNFGKNPLAHVGNKIVKYLAQTGTSISRGKLLEEFITDVRENELDEVLKYLVGTDRIKCSGSASYALADRLKEPNSGSTKSTKVPLLPAIPLDKPIREGKIDEL